MLHCFRTCSAYTQTVDLSVSSHSDKPCAEDLHSLSQTTKLSSGQANLILTQVQNFYSNEFDPILKGFYYKQNQPNMKIPAEKSYLKIKSNTSKLIP